MTNQQTREEIAKVARALGAHEAAELAMNLPAESLNKLRDILNAK